MHLFPFHPSTDSYARSIIFAPVQVEEEVVLTTTPGSESAENPDLTTIRGIDGAANPLKKEKDAVKPDVTSTTKKPAKEGPMDQESASTVEKAQQEDVPIGKINDQTSTESNKSSILLPVQESTVSSILTKSDSSSELPSTEKLATTTEKSFDLAKKDAPKLESLPQEKLEKTTISTTEKRLLSDSTTAKVRTQKDESFSSNQSLDESSTTESTISKPESSSETSVKQEEITQKNDEVPEFASRIYYLDNSQTSTVIVTENPTTKKYEEGSTSAAVDKSSTTEAIPSTTSKSDTSTEILSKLEDVSKQAKEYIPEFVTRIYYLDDSQTSTVIVTEKLPTTKKYKDDLITAVSPKTKTEEIKTSTDAPSSSSTIQESSTISSSSSTTEKIILRAGEVIILPSGRVLTGVDQLQEDIRSKLMTSDSDSGSSNVNPKMTEDKAVTDPLTVKESSTTSSVTDLNTTNTTVKIIESSSSFNVKSSTEKPSEKEFTTEHSIHQTIQLKTSEIIMDTNKLEQTTEKVTLESTTSAKVEAKTDGSLETTQSTEDQTQVTTLNLNEDKIAVTEMPVTTNKPDEASSAPLKKIDELTSEQTTQLPQDAGLETTIAVIDVKDSLKTSTEQHFTDTPQIPEKISVTLTNAVTSSVKDFTSTTSTLSTKTATSTTVQPITQSTTSEEIRESKILNETNEVTTLEWTTERNNNWTFGSSSSTISTTSLSNEAITTTDSSDLTTRIQDDSSIDTTIIPILITEEEGVRKINLRPNSLINDTKTNTSNSITLTQELVSNEGVKSTLIINVKPVTDPSSSESEESLEVDEVTQPEEEIKICTSAVCRKEGEESSKENEF